MKINDLREKNLNDPIDSEHLNIARGFRKKFKALYKIKFKKTGRQYSSPYNKRERWEMYLVMIIDGKTTNYSHYTHIANFEIPTEQDISDKRKKEIVKKIKEGKKFLQRKLVEFGWVKNFEKRIVE